jgi:hypothetical protein
MQLFLCLARYQLFFFVVALLLLQQKKNFWAFWRQSCCFL